MFNFPEKLWYAGNINIFFGLELKQITNLNLLFIDIERIKIKFKYKITFLYKTILIENKSSKAINITGKM